jgi:uncharacterized membrane protein YfcA
MGWNDAVISTVATLPIFAGMWAGTSVRNCVSQDLFRKLIVIVVAISGAQILTGFVH